MTRTQVPIAVVGAAALLPGSTDLAGFWRSLLTGRDLLTDVPASRWIVEDYYDADPRAADRTYGRRGAFLPEVDFDPVRYGVPPSALPATDTSQLLALLVADQVLADCAAGLPADRERISVVLGVSSLQLMLEASARLHRPMWRRALAEHGLAGPEAEAICDRIAAQFTPWQEDTFPGLLTNVVAGRIANRFDLHGTNHTTDAACASSLAALSAAVAELELGRSDLVLTGGVDTMNDITMYVCFTRTPALSPTGDCRPFAADADGTMLGEALVLFALKRLADAERDGDQVYAVVRGVGSSSDGRGTAIYAPLPEGQVRALRRAYEAAGYGPETVELVEAHGTGTSAGDAAEVAALREVFGASRAGAPWCALGSVKSQIGHTKAAAGAAGMLKAVLALQHQVLPPTIKVNRPNPALELERGPFSLNTRARPWVRPGGGHPRRASVSSFGFGGTNFHVALEEYVPRAGSAARPARRLPAAPTELVLLSAGSPAALVARVRELEAAPPMEAVARDSRRRFDPADPVRLGVVARDAADLHDRLADAARRIEAGEALPAQGPVHYAAGPAAPGRLAYLFPGQGAQYVDMGADLAIHLPRAREAWDRAAGLSLGDLPLSGVVFPAPAFTDAERAGQEALLTATEWAQPALAVHSLALLGVLGDLGIAPDCAAGHSFGELVALHAAGALDADTLVRLARRRGELMRDASAAPGAMLAVAAERPRVAALVADVPDLWLVNHNAPRQVVLAGSSAAIAAAADRFAGEGIATVRLSAATAFHSPLVAPASGPLLEFLCDADVRAPRLDVFAGADARPYEAVPDQVRRRLAAQLAEPVEFVAVIEAMYASGVRTFVEVGAGAALTGLVGQILGEREHVAVSLDRRGRNGVTSLQDGLARLAVRGVALDLAALGVGDAAAEPAPAVRRGPAIRIDGGNYGRPYPPAPGAAPLPPPPVQPDPTPAQPVVADEGWLRVIEDAQRQTAEAHAEYQRAMTESHLEYLRLAEAAVAGLVAAAGGQVPPVPAMPAPAAAPPPVFERPEPPPPPAAPPALDTDGLGALLLTVVAERTGYPAEMLNVDMELDTDLGIDSIKKVEILSAVRERIGDLPTGDLKALASMRTLRAIAESIGRPGSEPAAPVPPAPPAGRWVVRATAAPPSGLAMPGLTRVPLVVADDGQGVAPLLVERLAAHGVRAEVVAEVPPDARGVLLLDGLRAMAGAGETLELNRAAFRAARRVAARMAADGGIFVTVQDTGGRFGLGGRAAAARPWLGGLAALARTAAREWPHAAVRAIDCEAGGRPPAAVAGAIAAELLTGGPAASVGLGADGTRVTMELAAVPAAAAGPRVGPRSVLVATGGARGVTAAALRLLAAERRPRLVLLGRTPLADEPEGLSAATDEPGLVRLLAARHAGPLAGIAAEARRVLAVREIRETLAAIERSGASVRYVTADVRDADALREALAGVRRDWGPITGIVHGAGVLADSRIEDKTDEQFARVFDTKVEGLRALLAATEDDPLELLCAFSSVAAQFGNPGQADYAMANEVLNQVLCAEAAQRPGCVVRAIGWGPWLGGMVTPELAGRFRDAGVSLIDPEAGARAFVAELDAPAGDVRVIVSAGEAPAGGEFAAEVTVAAPTYAYLGDHVIGGVPVVPVATVLDWFAGAARSWRPGAPGLVIRDLRVLDRIALPRLADGGHRLLVHGQDAAGALDLDLRDEAGQAHYRASVDGAPPPPAGAWDGPAHAVPLAGPYDGATLFHGPALRAIRSAPGLSADGAEATVAGSRNLGWEGASGQVDPAALDGCLQLAVLWAREAGAGRTLPMSVRECRLHRPGPVEDTARCVVRAGRADDAGATCDVALLDPDGSVRVELLGVHLVRRPD